MYCKKCGKQISDDSNYCQYCGANLSSPNIVNDNDSSNKYSYSSFAKNIINNNVRKETTNKLKENIAIYIISLLAFILGITSMFACVIIAPFISVFSDSNSNLRNIFFIIILLVLSINLIVSVIMFIYCLINRNIFAKYSFSLRLFNILFLIAAIVLTSISLSISKTKTAPFIIYATLGVILVASAISSSTAMFNRTISRMVKPKK